MSESYCGWPTKIHFFPTETSKWTQSVRLATGLQNKLCQPKHELFGLISPFILCISQTLLFSYYHISVLCSLKHAFHQWLQNRNTEANYTKFLSCVKAKTRKQVTEENWLQKLWKLDTLNKQKDRAQNLKDKTNGHAISCISLKHIIQETIGSPLAATLHLDLMSFHSSDQFIPHFLTNDDLWVLTLQARLHVTH